MSSRSLGASGFSRLSAGTVGDTESEIAGGSSEGNIGEPTSGGSGRKRTVELKAEALGPLRSAVASTTESARFLNQASNTVEQVSLENREAASVDIPEVEAAAACLASLRWGQGKSQEDRKGTCQSSAASSRLLG
jgi:hypothetical protein